MKYCIIKFIQSQKQKLYLNNVNPSSVILNIKKINLENLYKTNQCLLKYDNTANYFESKKSKISCRCIIKYPVLPINKFKFLTKAMIL